MSLKRFPESLNGPSLVQEAPPSQRRSHAAEDRDQESLALKVTVGEAASRNLHAEMEDVVEESESC